MRTQLRKILPAEARAGLAPLLKAWVYSRDMELDPWEFAMPLPHLVELGVGESDLRWLVLNGYAECADELTTTRDPTRRFRPRSNVAFTNKTSFVIGSAGVLVAGEQEAKTALPSSCLLNFPEKVSSNSCLPRWESQSRILYLGEHIVKHYKRPSPNQEFVLSTFEEDGWPTHIDDPLPPKAEMITKCRLHDTIKCLNRNQETPLLYFRGDGTGEGVCWERVKARTITISAAPAKRRRLAA